MTNQPSLATFLDTINATDEQRQALQGIIDKYTKLQAVRRYIMTQYDTDAEFRAAVDAEAANIDDKPPSTPICN